MKYCFPTTLRIRNARQFRRVFIEKNRFFGRYYVLYYRQNCLDHGRVGVTITKRKIRRAVARSQLKRIIRENFRLQQYKLSGLDLVFIVKRGAETASKLELQQCSNQLITRLTESLKSS